MLNRWSVDCFGRSMLSRFQPGQDHCVIFPGGWDMADDDEITAKRPTIYDLAQIAGTSASAAPS